MHYILLHIACKMVENELAYVIIKRLPITIPMRTMPNHASE